MFVMTKILLVNDAELISTGTGPESRLKDWTSPILCFVRKDCRREPPWERNDAGVTEVVARYSGEMEFVRQPHYLVSEVNGLSRPTLRSPWRYENGKLMMKFGQRGHRYIAASRLEGERVCCLPRHRWLRHQRRNEFSRRTQELRNVGRGSIFLV